MSTWNRIQAETEAVQSLVKLYEQAQACREAYERAQMALPEPLKRFLGLVIESEGITQKSVLAPTIPPPQRRRPEGVGSDWFWVNVKDCGPNTLIAAVLRSAGGVLSSKDVIDRVQALHSGFPSGSIYNAATRLQKEGYLDRTAGWRLTKPDSAPIIDGEVVWWTAANFQKQETAAHRREAILHVLRHFQMGLMVVQIVEQLRNCSWVKAPVNKDLLKDDIKILLKDDAIRRRGNTNKYEIAPAEKGDAKGKAE